MDISLNTSVKSGRLYFLIMMPVIPETNRPRSPQESSLMKVSAEVSHISALTRHASDWPVPSGDKTMSIAYSGGIRVG